jgi:hypothetical protein
VRETSRIISLHVTSTWPMKLTVLFWRDNNIGNYWYIFVESNSQKPCLRILWTELPNYNICTSLLSYSSMYIIVCKTFEFKFSHSVNDSVTFFGHIWDFCMSSEEKIFWTKEVQKHLRKLLNLTQKTDYRFDLFLGTEGPRGAPGAQDRAEYRRTAREFLSCNVYNLCRKNSCYRICWLCVSVDPNWFWCRGMHPGAGKSHCPGLVVFPVGQVKI